MLDRGTAELFRVRPPIVPERILRTNAFASSYVDMVYFLDANPGTTTKTFDNTMFLNLDVA